MRKTIKKLLAGAMAFGLAVTMLPGLSMYSRAAEEITVQFKNAGEATSVDVTSPLFKINGTNNQALTGSFTGITSGAMVASTNKADLGGDFEFTIANIEPGYEIDKVESTPGNITVAADSGNPLIFKGTLSNTTGSTITFNIKTKKAKYNVFKVDDTQKTPDGASGTAGDSSIGDFTFKGSKDVALKGAASTDQAEFNTNYEFTATTSETTYGDEPYTIAYKVFPVGHADNGEAAVASGNAEYNAATGKYIIPASKVKGIIYIWKVEAGKTVQVYSTGNMTRTEYKFHDNSSKVTTPAKAVPNSAGANDVVNGNAPYTFTIEIANTHMASENLSVRLTNNHTTQVIKTYTLSDNEVTVDGQTVTVSVPQADMAQLADSDQPQATIALSATGIVQANEVELSSEGENGEDLGLTFENNDDENAAASVENDTLKIAQGDNTKVKALAPEGKKFTETPTVKDNDGNDVSGTPITDDTGAIIGVEFPAASTATSYTVNGELEDHPNDPRQEKEPENGGVSESSGNDGKTDDGKTDDGKTDDGKTDDGKTDDGKTDDGANTTGFADDSDIADYAKPYIKAAAEAGIIKGKENNRFDPRGGATRAEFATMIQRALGLKADKTESRFSDVKAPLNEDLINGVLACEDIDPFIVQGYPDGTFQPGKQITRAEGILMIWRAVGKPAYTGAAKFNDLADWYAEAANWGAEQGIVQGVGGGRFDGGATLTRQDLATMLGRAIEKGIIKLPTAAADDKADEAKTDGAADGEKTDAAAEGEKTET